MYAATSGYRNDGDAGLVHVGARYYDAQVGRFITRDTLLDQKPYLYCEHDPVNGLDPHGHAPAWIGGVIDWGKWIWGQAGGIIQKGGGALMFGLAAATLYPLISQVITDANEHTTMIRMVRDWHPDDPYGEKQLFIKSVIDGSLHEHLVHAAKLGEGVGFR